MTNGRTDCDQSSQRKYEHLELANRAQSQASSKRSGFNYEPLFSSHSHIEASKDQKSYEFAGKSLKLPVWICSMTGGTGKARHINQNLARAAGEFGLGLGLGSCRSLLESEAFWDDFNLRPIIGDETPFYANLGLAQVEQVLKNNDVNKIKSMLTGLNADGLIIHINPLQEWFQPEGDRFKRAPLKIIEDLLGELDFPIIVKEVGQGFGPRSMEALIKLPLAAIEFGAFGGTNFSLLEQLRSQAKDSSSTQIDKSTRAGFVEVGHTAIEMVNDANLILERLADKAKCRDFIISGGISDALEGFRLSKLINDHACESKAVFGQARIFLEHATEDYEKLQRYCRALKETLLMAENFLEVKK